MYNMPHYKIVVLGEGTIILQGRVGKTSMTLKYVNNQFYDSQQSTSNASYLQKQITLEDGYSCILTIWDTAGQQMYNAVIPLYYKDAHGAIIVYDISWKESFSKVKKWIQQLRIYGKQNISIVIVGNKCDMETSRQISNEQAIKFAKSFNCLHFLTSAKSGYGLQKLFIQITKQMAKYKTERITLGPRKKKKQIKLNGQRNKEEQRQKKKCCQ